MNSWCRNLELLIKSRTSLIWIRTKEEERLETLINFSCERLNIKRFIRWDCVSGIKGLINEEGKFSNYPLGVLNWLKEQSSEVSTILLVKDFHKFYDDPSINRTIKELSSTLKKTSHNLIISSHLFPSSEELDELMTILNLPLDIWRMHDFNYQLPKDHIQEYWEKECIDHPTSSHCKVY